MAINAYEQNALRELKLWQKRMSSKPSLTNRLSKSVQKKLNSYIPEKVHSAITSAIKQMVKGVLFGAGYTSGQVLEDATLQEREQKVLERIEFYKKTAAAEGGLTGMGGILLGLVDFPLLLSIKIKMLFDIAALYGYSVGDFRERLFLLHVFQLAFSSQEHRKKIYEQMEDWEERCKQLPEDINQFDWRSFQQEYRDYIDLAKLAQLVPVIGAAVGFVVNYRLIKKLGYTAMNAYRMRKMDEQASNLFV